MRVVIFCGLVLVAITRADPVCIPGEQKLDECNTCDCLPDGSGFRCTRMACPEFENEKGIDHEVEKPAVFHPYNHLLPTQSNPERICEPGSIVMKECNECVCSNDGTRLGCTRMACPEFHTETVSGLPDESHPKDYVHRVRRDPERICEPGSIVMKECNECVCSNDGTRLGCTRMACPEFHTETVSGLPDESHPKDYVHRVRRDPERICEPGSIVMKECNECVCSNDGTRLGCTRMACPEFHTETVSGLPDESHPKDYVHRVRRDPERICEPGSIVMKECNECVCSNDGTRLGCTRMACPEFDPETVSGLPDEPHPEDHVHRVRRDPERICEPGSIVMKECNECVCSNDGTRLGCTRMACPEFHTETVSGLPDESHPEDHVHRIRRDPKRICEPGRITVDGCEVCQCSTDGTHKSCVHTEPGSIPDNLKNPDGSIKQPHQIHNNPLLRTRRSIDDAQSCVPNSNIKIDCNWCTCMPDGRNMACTLMACQSQTFDLVRNVKSREARDVAKRAEDKFYCKPNEQFKVECNSCLCGSDGKTAMCTLAACPPSIP